MSDKRRPILVFCAVAGLLAIFVIATLLVNVASNSSRSNPTSETTRPLDQNELPAEKLKFAGHWLDTTCDHGNRIYVMSNGAVVVPRDPSCQQPEGKK